MSGIHTVPPLSQPPSLTLCSHSLCCFRDLSSNSLTGKLPSGLGALTGINSMCVRSKALHCTALHCTALHCTVHAAHLDGRTDGRMDGRTDRGIECHHRNRSELESCLRSHTAFLSGLHVHGIPMSLLASHSNADRATSSSVHHHKCHTCSFIVFPVS